MRISAGSEEQYPLLGSLLEAMSGYVDDNKTLKRTLLESCGGRDEAVIKALSLGGNPWVTVDDINGGDKRGAYSSARPNTIILGRDLAHSLVAGGNEAAHRECVIVLARGLLHWLSEADWSAPNSSPGAAFELLLAERRAQLKPPAAHEEPGAAPEPLVEPTPKPDTEPLGVANMLGAAILDIAKRHLGQKYAFSPTPNYDDPDWKGPFDCAEYVSYCAFRAYKIPYGVVSDPVNRFNSYSGYWRRDAETYGFAISARDALHIPGAILLRFPPGHKPPPYGHLSISLGNGKDGYEARGKQYGVVKHTATGRGWNIGVLIPGVLYDLPDGLGSDLLIFKVLEPPAGHSPIVEMIQRKLVGLGLMAEAQVNGIYDLVTAEAVSAFQDREGIVVDGEVGPDTGTRLGLGDIWKKAPVSDRPSLAANPPVDMSNFDSEVLTLARTLYGEARGEPQEGIVAVANVILNRVKSIRYPNTTAKVCLQRFQFSCWNANDPNRRIIEDLKPGANPKFDRIFEIAKKAVLGRLPNLVADALHYHARSVSPLWVAASPGAALVVTIGRHLFWRGIR